MNVSKEISTKKLVARLGFRLLIIIVSVLAVFLFLGPVCWYLMPFIVAYIVSAIMLMPIIDKLSGKYEKLRQMWAIIVVVGLLGLAVFIVIAVVYYVVKQGMELFQNWEYYHKGLISAIKKIADIIASKTSFSQQELMDYYYIAEDKLIVWVKTELPGKTPALINRLSDYAPTIGSVLLGIMFFLMATYFICADFPTVKSGLKSFIPQGVRPYLRQIKKAAGSATFGYFRAQIIISGMVGIISFIVFLIVGQKYAILFGLLVGVIDVIPLLGSGTILWPWIVILFFSGNNTKAVIFIILTVALFLFRRILEPKIVGDQTGLHPLMSLISLFIGIKMGGIIGMLIAPIVMMAVIGLYKVGFFTPTFNDIKLITKRMAEYTEFIKPEDSNDTSVNTDNISETPDDNTAKDVENNEEKNS